MHRRAFLQTAAVFVSAAAGPAASAATTLPIHRAVEYSMLPEDMSIGDRLKLARDCGFEQVECPTTPDEATAKEIKRGAQAAGLRIHSVMNMDHWKYPLSSPDPAVVEKSLAGARTSLRNAHFWETDSVLIVPAVIGPDSHYPDAYKRSQESIRKLLPMAEQLKVIIGIEEVWNKFLLDPVSYARYIDSFQSPYLKAYFDVGNVVLYGYPQDWIRVLGNRIAKLHIKDFSFRTDKATGNKVAVWQPLLEGDIDWKAVYDALHEIGYKGSATVELSSGNADYLREVNSRFEKILSGNVQPKEQEKE